MGTVYLAEQLRPVRRQVALTLIKRGMDSRNVLARFESERQALALMEHPNIARILDAGTTADGRPFFVMELVKGIPITEYCDAHRLNLNARLALFRHVCSAVQHTHQKGIIHRDLKPSNVLVESHDDKPGPKVIDFGLAKAVRGLRPTDQSLFTAFGGVAGTPL
jgi:serine/threonine protein kinase